MSEISAIFEKGGPLGSVPGYRVRPGQVSMAEAVAEAISRSRNLIAEAGTGTGKTFGYLVPILKKRCRAIISTEAKNLQNQISEKDLPELLRKMGLSDQVSVVLWKGKNNYICLDALERAMKRADRSTGKGAGADDMALLKEKKSRIMEFIRNPGNGEISDFEKVTGISNSRLLSRLAIDPERCVDSCDTCYHKKVHAMAQEAEIVIVNHSLLCYGAFIEDYLPNAQVVVIDEAHKFPDCIKQCYSTRFSSLKFLKTMNIVREQINEALGGDSALEKLEEKSRKRPGKKGDGSVDIFRERAIAPYTESIIDIRQSLKELEDCLPGFCEVLRSRYTDPDNDYTLKPEYRGQERDLPVVFSNGKYSQDENKCSESAFLEELEDPVGSFYPVLKSFIELINRTAIKMSNLTVQIRNAMTGPDGKHDESLNDLSLRMERCCELLLNYESELKEKIFPELSADPDEENPFDSEHYYRSYIRSPGFFEISCTPYNPAREFRDFFLESKINLSRASYVFTSATISTGGMSSFDGISESGSYNYFADFMMRLGLDNDSTDVIQIASPFNYYRNSLLCIPESLNSLRKSVSGALRPDAVLEMLAEAINITPGGIFILCTSYASVSNYYAALLQLIKTRKIRPRLVMYQGDDSLGKEQMTVRFRQDGRAVLIGTKSFWEGVDMPGKDLSMVIIDKIPFPQMTIDLKAERRYCETHRNISGKYGIFEMVDMPRAIIDLKQGVGRLIRKENDVGVTVICSPALTDGGRKQYRDDILESLPPMYFDSDIGVIPEFWNWHRKHDAGDSAR